MGPNKGVGDGPEATERGVTVGVAPMPGVEVKVGVRVWVTVGRAVGTTCRADAPQALSANESRIRLSNRNFMQYLDLQLDGDQLFNTVINKRMELPY